MADGKNIDIRIVATGGDQAAAEILKPARAAEEAQKTILAETEGETAAIQTQIEASAAAAAAMAKLAEEKQAMNAVPVDPAMAFEFRRIEERALAAGKAVDRAKAIAAASAPLTGLQELEFELQKITAQAAVADAALAKVEAGQLALNGNMIASLRGKVRQADTTAEIMGPEIEALRAEEASLAATTAAKLKSEAVKTEAAAAAAARHEAARTRAAEKADWATKRRTFNALGRGEGLGPLGRIPFGMSAGAAASVVGIGVAALETAKHLKEISDAFDSINTLDLSRVDAQLAGEIEAWKSLTEAIKHPLDALEKWATGTTVGEAFAGLNEQLKLNAEQGNAALERALNAGQTTAEEVAKMAAKIEQANKLLDAQDQLANTKRKNDEAEAVANGADPYEEKAKTAKAAASDEIDAIDRARDPEVSRINEERKNIQIRRNKISDINRKATEDAAALDSQINDLEQQADHLKQFSSRTNNKKVVELNENIDGLKLQQQAAPGAMRVFNDRAKSDLDARQKKNDADIAKLKDEQEVDGLKKRDIALERDGKLAALEREKEKADRQKAVKEAEKYGKEFWQDEKSDEQANKAHDRDQATSKRQQEKRRREDETLAKEATGVVGDYRKAGGNPLAAAEVEKAIANLQRKPSAGNESALMGLMERLLKAVEEMSHQAAHKPKEETRTKAIESRIRDIEARMKNNRDGN